MIQCGFHGLQMQRTTFLRTWLIPRFTWETGSLILSVPIRWNQMGQTKLISCDAERKVERERERWDEIGHCRNGIACYSCLTLVNDIQQRQLIDSNAGYHFEFGVSASMILVMTVFLRRTRIVVVGIYLCMPFFDLWLMTMTCHSICVTRISNKLMTTKRTIEASILFGGGNESYRKCCWNYHALESQHEMLLGCKTFFAALKYQVTKSNSSVDLVGTFGCLGRVVGRNLGTGVFLCGEGFLEPWAWHGLAAAHDQNSQRS